MAKRACMQKAITVGLKTAAGSIGAVGCFALVLFFAHWVQKMTGSDFAGLGTIFVCGIIIASLAVGIVEYRECRRAAS